MRPRPSRACHEGDGRGRDLVGSHDEIAFVLTTFVIGDDDDAAFSDLGDGLLDT